MRIQCDVCNTEEASVFCSADEAALCQACDHRVHHANKLASKHHRFSLLHHPLKDFPICDICQERRALLFCQQDRALLCRECDISIHKANRHTQKHSRFLLTGVKLSAPSPANQPSSSSSVSCAAGSARTAKPESKSASSVNDPHNLRTNSTAKTSESTSNHFSFEIESHWTNQEGPAATSTISEYLTETLPGWHVEDFLDPYSSLPYGFCKTHDQTTSPVTHEEFECTAGYFSHVKDLAYWVPQAPLEFQTKGMEGLISDEFKHVTKFNMKWKPI